MLAPLIVLAMVACISEGAVLSKCQVKAHLQEAFNKLPKEALLKINAEELIAKIVCHVELKSGFNTSAVNKMVHRHSPGRLAGPWPQGEISESNERLEEEWTLYGIFQLSDRVMCNSGSVPSVNLCHMDCRDFLDEDISDDIECALKIKTKLLSDPSDHAKAILKKMLALLFQSECSRVRYQEYFVGCN